MGVAFAFLFLVAVAAATGIAIYAVTLRTRLIQVTDELRMSQGFASAAQRQHEEFVGKYNAVVKKYNDDLARWNQVATAQKEEVNRLARWKNVANAEVKAAQMVQTAQETLAMPKYRAVRRRSTSWLTHSTVRSIPFFPA